MPFRLVQELGEGSWSQIATVFPGRIGKQCRERWHNQLRPNIRRDAWTHAEEVLLVAAHKNVGNRYNAKVLLICAQENPDDIVLVPVIDRYMTYMTCLPADGLR